jgi:hypothetical protein
MDKIMNKLNLRHGLDWLIATFAVLALAAVLQTFIIGKHFIIPTILLVVTIFLGNLAWYGFKQVKWAQHLIFWCGFVLTAHCFFALFWAKKYREILGNAFEPIAVIITLLLLALTWFYASKNQLFKRNN